MTDPQRKKLGIVTTDAQMFGGFDMQRMSQTPKQLIVEELEKQYEVVQIDPNSPIEEEVDVMMVVQPSSLTQPQLDNLVAAIGDGDAHGDLRRPDARDDECARDQSAEATARRHDGHGRQPPEPKGDIQQLWNLLGIKMAGSDQMGRFNADVVWQDYNPYKKGADFARSPRNGCLPVPMHPVARNRLNPEDEVVSGLQQILMLFPGAIEPPRGSTSR